MDTSNNFESLTELLSEIEEEYGGDISFIPPASEKLLEQAEKELNCVLPKIFDFFYTKETNGLQISNKLIYSIYDPKNKKTFVDNLQRANNPQTSYWFKHKPEVFSDYMIIGSDGEVCFSIYKHGNIDNPSIYICENPNTQGEVLLEKLDFGLEGLIEAMVKSAFE